MPTVLCVCVGCFVWCVCVHWDFSMKNSVFSFLIHIFPPKILVKSEYHVLWPVVRLMLHQFGEKWSANSTQVKNEGKKDARIDLVSQWTSKSEKAREREKRSQKAAIAQRESIHQNHCIAISFVYFSLFHLKFDIIVASLSTSRSSQESLCLCVPVFWSGLDVIREAIFVIVYFCCWLFIVRHLLAICSLYRLTLMLYYLCTKHM